MPGLRDQLVVDGEEAIRPQDRRRNPIKHDPIFLPPPAVDQIQICTNTTQKYKCTFLVCGWLI